MFSFFVLFCVGGLAHKKNDVVCRILYQLCFFFFFKIFALNCFDVFVVFRVVISCIF